MSELRPPYRVELLRENGQWFGSGRTVSGTDLCIAVANTIGPKLGRQSRCRDRSGYVFYETDPIPVGDPIGSYEVWVKDSEEADWRKLWSDGHRYKTIDTALMAYNFYMLMDVSVKVFDCIDATCVFQYVRDYNHSSTSKPRLKVNWATEGF